ncbi:MAG: amidase [Rhodospirillaceae bacterium]|jgi:aspartyl-tRNA(Asn)/glutamyl-tRNA(Gln) amidotransferase subunit A|nr:amidase [Rhodospirillaceae bacterium]MBT5812400.1 amidase [Rhodospirillaceae bacterium]
MGDTPLHEQTITELSRLIREGDLSPVDLTEYLLSRIDALNGPLNAFNLVAVDRAMIEAEAAETRLKAGHALGPLHGVPYAVKDIFDIAGLPTTAGSRTLGDNVATQDSTVTQRLHDAGMIALGKTITVEFAKGIAGINHIQGTPHNPWHKEAHIPGGSSAGSAVAVASGMAPMALGSDTGGSVRAPAGLCGTVGLKTTVGRVSRHGVFPLSWTLDSVGPLTRSVEDAALVYQAMQGEDRCDDSTIGVGTHDTLGTLKAGVKGLRVGIPQDVFFDTLDPEVEKAVLDCAALFADMGAHVTEIAYPEAKAAQTIRGAISSVEACVIHGERLKTMVDQMDPVVGPRMVLDLQRPATEYAAALRQMRTLRKSQAVGSLRDIDILLTPTIPAPAIPVAAFDQSLEIYLDLSKRYSDNTATGNVLGLCGLSVPCGFSNKGLPIGLMIYAKPFAEDVALRAGYAYEQATEWRHRHPDLGWAAPS